MGACGTRRSPLARCALTAARPASWSTAPTTAARTQWPCRPINGPTMCGCPTSSRSSSARRAASGARMCGRTKGGRGWEHEDETDDGDLHNLQCEQESCRGGASEQLVRTCVLQVPILQDAAASRRAKAEGRQCWSVKWQQEARALRHFASGTFVRFTPAGADLFA